MANEENKISKNAKFLIINNVIVFKILLIIVTLFAPIYAKLMCDVEKRT